MTRWNWVDDLILPLALAVLSAAWLSPWVLWATRNTPRLAAPAVAPVTLAALTLGGFIVMRAALAYAPSFGWARVVILLASLAAVLGAVWWTGRFGSLGALARALADWDMTISPTLVGLAACAYAWWQGLVLAGSHRPQAVLERAFYSGIGGLALLFAVSHSRPRLAPGEALAAVVALFATGLAGLALVSFENARRYQETLTGTWLRLNRHWTITVVVVIGSILLIALAAAAGLTPAAFARLAAVARQVFGGMGTVLLVAAGLITLVLAWLLFPALEAIARLLAFDPAQLPKLPEPQQFVAETGEVATQTPWVAEARQLVAAGLLVALLALVFWWAVQRPRPARRREQDELRESIVTRELVWQQLRNLFRRAQRPAATAPFLALSGPGDDPRLIVRRAYQAMLEWAQARSVPRAAGQTPAAYADRLAQAVPGGRSAIVALTAAYEHARYGLEPPSLEEARRAQGAALALRALAHPPGD